MERDRKREIWRETERDRERDIYRYNEQCLVKSKQKNKYRYT